MAGFFRRLVFLIAVMAGAMTVGQAQTAEPRVSFPDSIASLPNHISATKREVPTAEDTQSMEFGVALRLRNYAEMQARIARGEIIPRAELESTYLPSKNDYATVVSWLKAEGFTITRDDPSRLVVYAQGKLPQVRKSFQVHLVSVTANGGRAYHAADTEPSLPQSIAGPVLGINHLQPYHQRRKHVIAHSLTNNAPPYTVNQILTAYNATNLGVTGAGQKIAILIDTVPTISDVTTFWTNNGVAQSSSNLEFVNVNNATLSAPSGEETLDVEWSSGIAPGAKIRVYAAGSLANSATDQCLQQIINDLPTQPDLHVLSISLGDGETALSQTQFATDAQFFATLASAGVSVFVSTGDYGSTPSNTAGANNGPLQVESYASDPSVTGVGGTTLNVDATTGLRTSESAWGGVNSTYGSGGGVSIQYKRPVWQKGNGVPAGTMRCVPDASLVADPNTGAYVYFNGGATGYGGTSWSAPVWAGFCALINQARANKGLTPLGLMNPHLYPLLGTNNFVDITTGSNATPTSNGLYQATIGYDMATGLGVPNMGFLLSTLVAQPPAITRFSPASGTVYSTIVITGTDLASATSVTLNGVSVPFTVISNSQLGFTVAPGTSGGVITVITPVGTATSSTSFTLTALPVSSVVISQVYCEGGSNYQNDFIELFNAGTTTVDLSTWSVQIAGATSRRWLSVPLSGTLAPAHHYLVGGAYAGSGDAPLPTPDVSGTFSLDSSTGGKVALVSNQTTLTRSNPVGASGVVDFMGYGTANAYQGSGAAQLTTANYANFRVGGGRSNTNDNAADFVIDLANPRNSASPTTPLAWPDLTLSSTHAGSFTQADTAQSYAITVTNAGTDSTGGTVTVTDVLPTGLTATAFSGDGWTTDLPTLTATRSDTLAAGASYPPLTLTVNVAVNATASLTNTVQVSGGGDLNSINNIATDPTIILTMTPLQSWRYIYFGSTANSGAGADTTIAAADGLPNLLKYALGLNPLVSGNTSGLITPDITTGFLRLTVTKNPAATDVTFTIQGTNDLSTASSWSTNGVIIDQNTTTLLQAHSSTSLTSGSYFLRLNVTHP